MPSMWDVLGSLHSPVRYISFFLFPAKHHVSGNRTVEPFPEGTQMAVFGKISTQKENPNTVQSFLPTFLAVVSVLGASKSGLF